MSTQVVNQTQEPGDPEKQMTISIKTATAALAEQVGVCLSITGALTPFFLADKAGDVEEDVATSAAATFIQACNRLDHLLTNEKNWNLQPYRTNEDELLKLIQTQQERHKVALDAAKELMRPCRRMPVAVEMNTMGAAVYVGDPERPETMLLAEGPTLEIALKNFDDLVLQLEQRAAETQLLRENLTKINEGKKPKSK